ncbi:MAG: hypothetical protein PHP57_00405 [Sideroxydans sp.]|nr:hypothetical protein [Sideroxydans sp.]
MNWIRNWLIPIGGPATLVLIVFLATDMIWPDKSGEVWLRPAGCAAAQSAGATITSVESGCHLQAVSDSRWAGFTTLKLPNDNRLQLNSSEVLSIAYK